MDEIGPALMFPGLFIISIVIATLLPVPGKSVPDAADLLAEVLKEVLKKL